MNTALVREPVYQQLNQLLRGLLASGEFATGGRFLAEREVSERYDVSRATANKALANLVAEGALEFRKGIGTFVRAPLLAYDLKSLISFTAKARAAGRKPSTQVLALDRIAAPTLPEPVAAALKVSPKDPIYYMERLRLADEQPVILERRYVAAEYCKGMSRHALQGSIYHLWITKYGLRIGRAQQTIRAANLNTRDAFLLGVRRGAAALLVECTGSLSDGAPLWFERTLYRGDAYEFHNQHPSPGRLLSSF